MQVQQLIEQITQAGVSVWDLRHYVFVVEDAEQNTYTITTIELDDDKRIGRLIVTKQQPKG